MYYINERTFGMFILVGIAVIIGIILLAVFYGLYVQLIRKKNKTAEAMGGIDVQLKKRYDLIPNILTIANKFMEHEKSLITEITDLRTQAAGLRSNAETITEKMHLDNTIASKMGQLMVNVENYPQLKSDQTMIQAMQTYSEVEEHIAAARRFYNSAVNDLNNSVEIFPSSMIAGMLGIAKYPFFEADEISRKSVNASDYFNK